MDFIIELHPGTSPISMTPHRMASVELQELKVQLQDCWTRVLLDRAFHLRSLRFCLLGKGSSLSGMTCVRRHFKN